VVTDGNDNASTISLELLVRLAQQDDVVVFAIGLLAEEDKRGASKAKRAPGFWWKAPAASFIYPKDVAEVDRIAHEVAHDIRNQYTIAYTPSNVALDGTYRQIKRRNALKFPGPLSAQPLCDTAGGDYMGRLSLPAAAACSAWPSASSIVRPVRSELEAFPACGATSL
jgi:hypothetical protein